MDGGPLMDPESIGEAIAALAAFPGLADVAVIEHGAGQDDQCLIAYVVASGPGLDVAELHAHARKTLAGASMPAVSMADELIPVTPAWIRPVDHIPRPPPGAPVAPKLPVPELAGLLPYQAPAPPRQELLCEL